ncbi:hypothetical protein [Gelidibacter japonicus]|nr:hypothetical protein [Gelidibacter japonicus]
MNRNQIIGTGIFSIGIATYIISENKSSERFQASYALLVWHLF